MVRIVGCRVRLALKAAFASESSVLHVVGFERPPAECFSRAEIVAIKIFRFASAILQEALIPSPLASLPEQCREKRGGRRMKLTVDIGCPADEGSPRQSADRAPCGGTSNNALLPPAHSTGGMSVPSDLRVSITIVLTSVPTLTTVHATNVVLTGGGRRESWGILGALFLAGIGPGMWPRDDTALPAPRWLRGCYSTAVRRWPVPCRRGRRRRRGGPSGRLPSSWSCALPPVPCDGGVAARAPKSRGG